MPQKVVLVDFSMTKCHIKQAYLLTNLELIQVSNKVYACKNYIYVEYIQLLLLLQHIYIYTHDSHMSLTYYVLVFLGNFMSHFQIFTFTAYILVFQIYLLNYLNSVCNPWR